MIGPPSTLVPKISDPPAQDRRRGEVSSRGDEAVEGSEDRMRDRQLPLVQGLEGGDGVERWEAYAAHDVGLLISSYLEQHPPPARSDLARRLAVSGQYLQEAGCLDLQALGDRRLRAV
jgi:hypothetical protein